MLYREVGEFKTSYAADQQTFPISFDKIAYFKWFEDNEQDTRCKVRE